MNLMIDLETLGTSSKAPVISIGACYFDETGVKQHFYAVLDIKQQIDSGLRKVDADTIKWWMGQEGAAKKVFQEELGVQAIEGLQPVEYYYTENNRHSLEEFSRFCFLHEDIKPWGNGSTFDITILESLLEDYNLLPPWKFYNIRDMRTFKEYVYDGSETKREGTHHNALDDAIYQAEVVVEGMNRNKNKPDPKTPKPLSIRNSFALFLADWKASRSK